MLFSIDIFDKMWFNITYLKLIKVWGFFSDTRET